MQGPPMKLHVEPAQHGVLGWHGRFGPEQRGVWQTPLKQLSPEQQSAFAAHAAPAGEQPEPTQTPPEHAKPLQHGCGDPAQFEPAGRHCDVLQTPFTQEKPEQHSAFVVHAFPPHGCAWHTPPTQNVEQHSAAVAHGAPLA